MSHSGNRRGCMGRGNLQGEMAPKVAVIGAGAGGLACIKIALEAGLEPTAYERDSWLGGLWNYSEDSRNCAARATITNVTKHMMCYSDYPMPKEYPNYLPAEGYQRYLESYAKEFNLTEKIRFNEDVLEVRKCSDFAESGKWEVHSRNSLKSGEERESEGEVKIEVYDFLMVCTGIYALPLIPEIPGMEDFTGKMIHSQAYKTFKGFENKRVLVVGLGNTAGDIACELSRHASQVYISTRRGSWVAPRLVPGGRPLDLYVLRRVIELVPRPVYGWVIRKKLESLFNLANFGLETEASPLVQLPIISDELPHRIVTGSVIVKNDVKAFQGRRVLFKDDTDLDDIDVVIFATGFDARFPILSNSWLQPKEQYTPLYKYIFSPELERPTLAIIGAFRAAGPVPPVLEMQARWAVQVFKGCSTLPDKQTMIKDILAAQEDVQKRVYAGNRFYHFLKGYIPYMDEIGTLAGVKPNLLKLLLQDPGLALKCYTGPCIPAQYRLMGPGAWPGAKEVIEGVEESLITPIKTRVVKSSIATGSGSGIIYAIILIVFLAVLVYFFV